MILPKKHLSIDESLFGYGAFLLNCLETAMTVDDLWEKYRVAFEDNNYSVKFTFDQYLIAIDYLYLIGAVKFDEGRILRI